MAMSEAEKFSKIATRQRIVTSQLTCLWHNMS